LTVPDAAYWISLKMLAVLSEISSFFSQMVKRLEDVTAFFSHGLTDLIMKPQALRFSDRSQLGVYWGQVGSTC